MDICQISPYPSITCPAVTDVRFDSGERNESLMVLYDDMKLAFNGLLYQILAAKVSEEAYSELTLQGRVQLSIGSVYGSRPRESGC